MSIQAYDLLRRTDHLSSGHDDAWTCSDIDECRAKGRDEGVRVQHDSPPERPHTNGDGGERSEHAGEVQLLPAATDVPRIERRDERNLQAHIDQHAYQHR